MNLQQIYELGVKMGINADLRGTARVKYILKRSKEMYDNAGVNRKKKFDKEKLSNPYSDTRVFVGSKKKLKK